MPQATYLTIAEFREHYDLRLLQQLGSDNGTPLSGDPPTDTYGILLNAIERGSADIESHALRGGRYTLTNLADLVADDDWTLKSLTADMAIAHLFMRRGGTPPPSIENRIEQARKDLEDMRDGREIFNSGDHIAAGKAKAVILTDAQRARLNMVSDREYFPRRQQRLY